MNFDEDELKNHNSIFKLYTHEEGDQLNYPLNIKCNEKQWNVLKDTLREYLRIKSASSWDVFCDAYNEICSERPETNEELYKTYYNWMKIKEKLDILIVDQSDDVIQDLIEIYKSL